MKQLILFAVLLIGSTVAAQVAAQDNAVEKYFSEYLQNDDYTKISVTGKMFSLFTEIDTEDEYEKALLEAMSKIKGIKGIINDDAENGNKMYADALSRVEKGGSFEELMSVEEADENVKFLIRDEDGEINELLMVRSEKRQFMVISLYGVIDLNSIGRLSKIMKVKGMEGFGDMKKH